MNGDDARWRLRRVTRPVCILQGSRIEEQRSELPPVQRSAPTVPDEDFISLIQRFQSNRLEEQRSSLPSATMPILLTSGGVRRAASYGSRTKANSRRKK
jgi:GoLoco motif